MAWLTGYDKRIKVTADSAVVDADLTWFPIIIRLGTSVGKTSADVSCVFDELTSDANRKKIAITKADGETQLYVEIEQWDDANEKAVLHCGLDGDILDADADTDYYIYYDVDHADNNTYVGDTSDDVAENVWDTNFKTVQHMADATTSTILDSTQYDNHGTKDAANQPAVTASGKIGNAQHFNGSSDWITLVENGSLDLDTTITMEAWVRFDGVGSTLMPLIQKRAGSASNYGMRKGIDGQTWSSGADELDVENFGSAWCIWGSDDANFAAATWYHIVVTYDETTHIIYKNGVAVTSSKTYGTCPQNLIANNVSTELGALDSEGNYLDGILDEVRISDVVRTVAWVKASYNSGNDSLLTYGSEESSWSGHGAHAFSLT